MKKTIIVIPAIVLLLMACSKSGNHTPVLVITSDTFLVSTANNSYDTYQYDQNGSLTNVDVGNNVFATSYQYDANGFAANATTLYKNSPYSTAKYTHNANGKLIKLEELGANGKTTDSVKYTYFPDRYQATGYTASGTSTAKTFYYYTADGQNISYELAYTSISLPPVRTNYNIWQ